MTHFKAFLVTVLSSTQILAPIALAAQQAGSTSPQHEAIDHARHQIMSVGAAAEKVGVKFLDERNNPLSLVSLVDAKATTVRATLPPIQGYPALGLEVKKMGFDVNSGKIKFAAAISNEKFSQRYSVRVITLSGQDKPETLKLKLAQTVQAMTREAMTALSIHSINKSKSGMLSRISKLFISDAHAAESNAEELSDKKFVLITVGTITALFAVSLIPVIFYAIKEGSGAEPVVLACVIPSIVLMTLISINSFRKLSFLK